MISPASMAYEVRDIGSDRGLPPEMRVREGNAFEVPPQAFFGFSQLLAEDAGRRYVVCESEA